MFTISIAMAERVFTVGRGEKADSVALQISVRASLIAEILTEFSIRRNREYPEYPDSIRRRGHSSPDSAVIEFIQQERCW